MNSENSPASNQSQSMAGAKPLVALRYTLSREAAYILSHSQKWASDFLEWNQMQLSPRLTTPADASWRWVQWQWQKPPNLQQVTLADERLTHALLIHLKERRHLPLLAQFKGLLP